MKISFVFPGQGSQYVGMGKDLYENFDEVKEIYKAASEALGYDIAGLSFNGPQEELNKTYRTQPCLLTASYAAFKVLTSKGLTPSCMAGHSLGEYSAITASGAISFRDAAILTEKRGRFMQDAVPEGKGLMAAVLGLDREAINKICGSVNSGYVAPANYNCPGQTVIAGEKAAVEEAVKLAQDAGAKRAVLLAVSVPSHCRLMEGASNKLSELLEGIELKYPEIPIVNNADAAFLKDADSIKDSLVRQLNSPLLWEDSIRLMVESGVDSFIEVGPKKVLAGLIKRIDGTVKIYNVEDTKTLEDTLKALT
jgi:[acyl-carrier-protein] S-malonyltransferase